MSTSPSTIARSIAGQMWPDVQQQKQLANGVFWFSCAGHGGIVALVDKLNLDPKVIQAARDSGLVHYTTRINHGRRHKTYCTAVGYAESDLRRYAQVYPQHTEEYEVWIGEEDCDWATLAMVSPELRDGMAEAGFTVDFDETVDTVKRYNESFYHAVMS